MAEYDAISIGVGPAGMSATVFMARAKLRVLAIGDISKTGLINAQEVGNYMFADGASGDELLSQGLSQIKKYGAEVVNDEVVDVREGFEVTFKNGTKHHAKVVVIATGITYTPMGIAGEKERVGRGVAMCVACDGPLFKNKRVAVVGNGNHAASEAIELLAHTKNITLYSQGREWNIDPALLKRLEQAKILLKKERIKAFVGDKLIKGIELQNGTRVEVDGVFSAMGVAGAVSLAMKVGAVLDNNFIVIDRDGRTNVEGVYAAGACTGGNYQIAKSVGEGCNAAIHIIKKLKGLDTYSDLT